jgi:hypothetical protein
MPLLKKKRGYPKDNVQDSDRIDLGKAFKYLKALMYKKVLNYIIVCLRKQTETNKKL